MQPVHALSGDCMFLLKLLTVYLAGACNRGRGSGDFLLTKSFDYLALGIVLTFLMDVNVLWAALLPITTVIGYGEPWGKAIYGKVMVQGNYEWWQKWMGVRDVHPLSALGFFGILHGFLLWPAAFWEPKVTLFGVTMILLWPLAAHLASFTQHNKAWPWWVPTIRHNKWEKGEWILGWLMGLSALLIGFI